VTGTNGYGWWCLASRGQSHKRRSCALGRTPDGTAEPSILTSGSFYWRTPASLMTA
jgi:hypothetical protein